MLNVSVGVNGVVYFSCFSLQSKIVRVLNLWQKNGVFPIEVIQPLMDLAGDPNNADLAAAGGSVIM